MSETVDPERPVELPEEVLAPIAVPSAYKIAAERLRHAIHLGTFAPGSPLPAERDLAKRLGVSRVTLREALRILEGSGYIETREPRRGPAVVRSGSADGVELVRARLVQQIGYFDDVVDFRVAVEGMAASLAADRRSDADLDRIRSAVNALEGAGAVPSFRRADSAFHLAIATASQNELLRAAIEDARDRMFIPTDAMPFDVMLASTAAAHQAVLRAIEARDSCGAREAMIDHIERTHDELRVALGLASRAVVSSRSSAARTRSR